MTEFRYLTVTEWGGVWVRPPAAEKMPDGEVFVHHVGGGAWMGGTVSAGEAASRRAAISVFYNLNVYATRPKDEGGKGYSFLDYDALGWYDRFNDIAWIAEGRGKWMSAATLDRNEQGEAFCMCGNYSLRAPLDAELEMCARGIVFMADQGWTTRTATIYGHKDNPAHPGATGCPGDHLYPKLPQIRTRVAELYAPPQPDPEPDTKPTPVPEEDDDMINAAYVRIEGYADQFLALPISSETKTRLGNRPPIVVKSDKSRADLEAEFGYKLTPG